MIIAREKDLDLTNEDTAKQWKEIKELCEKYL